MPRRSLPSTLLALLASLAGLPAPALAREPGAAAVAERVEFLRLSRDDAGGLVSLDTSIVEYREDPVAAARRCRGRSGLATTGAGQSSAPLVETGGLVSRGFNTMPGGRTRSPLINAALRVVRGRVAFLGGGVGFPEQPQFLSD